MIKRTVQQRKTRSDTADEGSTNNTLCAAADQCGKEVSDCFHQSRQLRFGATLVALARYVGSSALRLSSTSAGKKGNAERELMESALG